MTIVDWLVLLAVDFAISVWIGDTLARWYDSRR